MRKGRVVVLAFLAASACTLCTAGSAGANHSQTELVSIGPSGANGPLDAHYGGISRDGSRVYFTTTERLVSADTDSSVDVYERSGGTTTTLISTGPINGNGANDARFDGVSADGTRVFFDTSERLTSTDTDTGRDVYQRSGGTTTQLSIGPAGGNTGIDSFYAGSSTDGTKVFIVSYDKLTNDDTDDGRKDVYERSGGTTTLISTGGSGPYGADYDGATPDGTHVFFHSDESLVASDTDGIRDVYEHSGGTTRQVSTGPVNGNGPFLPLWKGVSQDGSRAFFETSEQLTTSDTDSYADVYERSGGTTTKLSLGPNGGNGAYDANFVRASVDGSKIWLETREPLVSSDTDGFCEDEFGQFTLPCFDVYQRSGGNTTLISAGGNGSYDASFAAATADGTHVFFHTSESLSPEDDSSSTFDIYDRSGGNTTLVSVGGTGAAFLEGISQDGARVFFSTYDQLVGADTDNLPDVYERYGRATTLISTGPTSTSGSNFAVYDSNSEDGTKVFFDTDERLTSDDTDSSFDTYSATTGYPRPKGATPALVSLVPAFNQCVVPNRTHGPPLSLPSCSPPVQSSSYLTVGTPDVNGAVANSAGSVRMDVVAGDPATPADEADNLLAVSVKDVRKKSDLSDYGGQLRAAVSLQITDRYNGASLTDSGTASNITFAFSVPCQVTSDTAIGSTCSIRTTADALGAGTVREGKRAIWELGQVRVFDGGADGIGSTAADNTLFMVEGIFVP